jgi:SAM-dependent methyltransferase
MKTRLRVKDFYRRVWKEYADPVHHPITERSLALQGRIVDARIRKDRPSRILDLGCGPAPVIRPDRAPVVVSADMVLEMLLPIRRARGGPVVCLNAVQLPFPENSFDFVWCGLLTDHIRDLGGWFTELVRILSTGGTLGMACWDRSRLPQERYPENREMSYTTSRGEEFTVESLPNWEEAMGHMVKLDPGTQIESCPVAPEEYVLQTAFSNIPGSAWP